MWEILIDENLKGDVGNKTCITPFQIATEDIQNTSYQCWQNKTVGMWQRDYSAEKIHK